MDTSPHSTTDQNALPLHGPISLVKGDLEEIHNESWCQQCQRHSAGSKLCDPLRSCLIVPCSRPSLKSSVSDKRTLSRNIQGKKTYVSKRKKRGWASNYNYISNKHFIVFFLQWITPGCAEVFLLALCSGISRGAQGSLCGVRDY